MKTRNGFVSNSSSSSFVLVGWEQTLTTEQERKLLNEYYNDQVEKNEDYLQDSLRKHGFVVEGDDPQYCGLRVAHFSDYEVQKIDLLKVNQCLSEANEIAQLLGLPPPAVFAGTTYG